MKVFWPEIYKGLEQGGKAAFTKVGRAFFEPHQEYSRLTQGCSRLTKVARTHCLQFFYEHLGWKKGQN